MPPPSARDLWKTQCHDNMSADPHADRDSRRSGILDERFRPYRGRLKGLPGKSVR